MAEEDMDLNNLTDDDDEEIDDFEACDVCRWPYSEDGNEKVVCDVCRIIVHQNCYGIMEVPTGPWVCSPCSVSLRPDCLLCPNRGGAMKPTKIANNWAHVACALWIPEVSISDIQRMEPISKIGRIPEARWALICAFCEQRVGACIKCSVSTCPVPYHVTCAFKKSLEMLPVICEDKYHLTEDGYGIALRSYCLEHSTKTDAA